MFEKFETQITVRVVQGEVVQRKVDALPGARYDHPRVDRVIARRCRREYNTIQYNTIYFISAKYQI